MHRLVKPARTAAAALATVLLLASPITQADDSATGEYWDDWKALGAGYVGRRKVPPKANFPASERRLATTQERGKSKNAKLKGKGEGKSAKSVSITTLASSVSVDALWLRTGDEGIYSISIADLATELGKSATEVRKSASQGILLLNTAQNLNSQVADRPVSWYYDSTADSVLFVAEAYNTFYSDKNATHIKLGGKGDKTAQPMRIGAGKAPRASGVEAPFAETLVFEEEPDFYFSVWTAASEADADYWFWDYLWGANKDLINVPLNIPNPAPGGTAQLRVTLRGGTDLVAGNDHQVYAELKGEQVGPTISWDGFEEKVLIADFDQSLLDPAGNNTLVLRSIYPAGTVPVQWLDKIEVDYSRKPVASAGKLWMHDVAAGTQTVTGFTSDDIMVIESPGGDAVLREDVRVDADGAGGWTVTFEADGDVDFLVAERATAGKPALIADASSALNDSNNHADYLIIAPFDFSATAEALAAHRRSLSSDVIIVWLDDIYDEFSAGRKDPAAIGRFMNRVTTAWQSSPTNVALIGKGSLDEKDRMGYADSFLPVLMTSNPWALAPSDSRLLGFEDNAPFAIGRLPITNDLEGVAYVDKLIAYETTTPGSERFEAVLVADNPDVAGDFHANSDLLAVRLLNTLGFNKVTKLYHPNTNVRASLIQSDTWNTGFVSYDGHGSITQTGAGSEKYISSGDAELLENVSYPIFSALTCAVGDDTYPGYRSLAGALVLNPAGGAIASVAPTGLSLDYDAQILSNAFVDSLFLGNNTIGDALREAKAQTHGSISAFMPRMYSVVGEPAVRAR